VNPLYLLALGLMVAGLPLAALIIALLTYAGTD
jgi:hypothetical protein